MNKTLTKIIRTVVLVLFATTFAYASASAIAQEDDEFEEFSEVKNETLTSSQNAGEQDEFCDFSKECDNHCNEAQVPLWQQHNFSVSVLVLMLTLIAGILVRFKTTRKLRNFMLLGSLVYLGFINGGCPCMISSFQNFVLSVAGISVKPVLLLWFLGLIPLTYFFGKVWCGWVCHLGALQEFIYRPGIFNGLKSTKAQKILKWIRIITFVVLTVQVLVTKTNIFKHYDPFKVAFNLFSANTLGYILLVVLLISSLLIYRPFCRAFCPVGLILGWVSRIPGSKKISKNSTCVDCKACSTKCKQNAMVYENKKSCLNTEDCIVCGECIDACKFSSIEIKGIAK